MPNDIKSRRISRDKLQAVFKSHELVVAFENLTQDVAEVLPGSVAELAGSIAGAVSAAESAQLAAAAAEDTAADAQDVAAALDVRVSALEAMPAGSVIEDEGAALPLRGSVNFVGAGVSVTDSGTKTIVTIGGGGGGSSNTYFPGGW